MTSEGFRLSPQQRRIWTLINASDKPIYHVSMGALFEGELKVDQLQRAIEACVARNEILRTNFQSLEGAKLPVQVIGAPQIRFEKREVDGAMELQYLEELIDETCLFDHNGGPLLHAFEIKSTSGRTGLVLKASPMIADMASLDLIFQEIVTLYEEQAGQTITLEDPIQYADLSDWLNENLESEEAEEGKHYWSKLMQNWNQHETLGVERPVAKAIFDFGTLRLPLSSESIEACSTYAQKMGQPLSQVYQIAWQCLLTCLQSSNQNQMGLIHPTRGYEELEDAIGPFASCVPLMNAFERTQGFGDVVKQIKDPMSEAMGWAESFQWSSADQYAAFQFQFHSSSEWKISQDLKVVKIIRNSIVEPCGLNLTLDQQGKASLLQVTFDANRYCETTVQRLVEQYQVLLNQVVADDSLPLDHLNLLSENEYRRVVLHNNQTQKPFDLNQLAISDFESWAAAQPNQPALRCEDNLYSYAALNQKANQLANLLGKQGVSTGDIVGILLPRSTEMIVALLAIHKIGAAYLPMDAELPAARLQAIIEDANLKTVITNLASQEVVKERHHLCFDDPEINWQNLSQTQPSRQIAPENLAYVVYTSGSTGTPKGVAVSHANLNNYRLGVQEKFATKPGLHYAMISTFAADLGNTSLYPALTTGGCLHIISEDRTTNPFELAAYFEKYPIDVMKIVPSHLAALLSSDLAQILPRRTLICGGEALTNALVARVRQLHPKLQFINHYGPSEATVGVTTFSLPDQAELPSNIPIGSALPNSQTYILDHNLTPAPLGFPGVLFLGGAGLARGYLNKPDLTAARFLPNPFAQTPGERMYNTGDLVKWTPENQIRFLGRVDHQVKIHGFRIELGDIEAHIKEYPGVDDAVVLVWPHEEEQQLVAYVVGKELSTDFEHLRETLRDQLPPQMVPSHFELLKQLPLTPNGKIDRKALPEPQFDQETNADYEAPRNEIEAGLAALWQECLHQDRIGIHDNFFALGGDSIVGIQMVAKAHRRGLKFRPRDLFQFQTLAELAQVVSLQNQDATAEQTSLSDDFPLSPIQHWFFNRKLNNPHFYNQALLLEIKYAVDQETFSKVIEKLADTYTAFRLRFRQSGSNWYPKYADKANIATSTCDFSQSQSAEDDLLSHTNKLQQGMHLEKGPLAAFSLIKMPQGQRLFVALHHAIVDGVSWRTLIGDLSTLIQASSQGKPLELPPESLPISRWTNFLASFANKAETQVEVNYWKDLATLSDLSLPYEYSYTEDTYASLAHSSRSLDAKSTQKLLAVLANRFNATINEALLASVTAAFRHWSGQHSLLLSMESHGRESTETDLDTSRSLGWYTVRYPLLLKTPETTTPITTLKSIKEQVRAVPNQGMGFSALKYLCDDAAVRALLDTLPHPVISFNYLGQVDRSMTQTGALTFANEKVGESYDANEMRPYPIDWSGSIRDGQLHFTLGFSQNRFNPSNIDKFADACLQELHQLIECAEASTQIHFTPSDFPLAQLPQTDIDRLVSQPAVQALGRDFNLAKLTSLQEGLFFHSYYLEGEDPYFVQLDLPMKGQLDLHAMEKAWQQVINRHEALRIFFLAEGLTHPIQVIQKQAKAPFIVLDYTQVQDQEQAIAQFLANDRKKGFDLTQPPLQRLTILDLGQQRYHVVWSNHHILIDGWSRSQIINELFQNYASLREKRTLDQHRAPAFSNYLEWLQKQSQADAETFWRTQLETLEEPFRLPAMEHRGPEANPFCAVTSELIGQDFELLQTFVKRQGLTINTFFQGSWILLLSLYANSSKVLYGMTTAGRPTDLPESESMVGLFINTLPVHVQLEDKQTVADWLRDLQKQLADLRFHEFTALADIQKWSNIASDQPLFDTIALFENYPSDIQLGDSKTEDELEMGAVQAMSHTNYPLCLAAKSSTRLVLDLGYHSQHFDRETCQQILVHVLAIMQQMMTQPYAELRDIKLPSQQPSTPSLPATESFSFLTTWQKQVETNNSTALIQDQQQLSYRDLDNASSHLAAELEQHSIGPEKIVAIHCPRSPEFIVAALAVIKTGAAFVALDVDNPPDRLQFILEDTQADALLHYEEAEMLPFSYTGPKLAVEINKAAATIPVNQPEPGTVAYIIYTSGSTGNPKGVLISYDALNRFCQSAVSKYELGPEDTMVQFSSLSFDTSIEEIFPALSSGATLVLRPNALPTPVALLAQCREQSVTVLDLPTAYWHEMVAAAHQQNITFPNSLRQVIIGGEAALADRIQQWHALPTQSIKLHNTYGPTETTVVASSCLLEQPNVENPVPIGSAFGSTSLYVVDRHLNLRPKGLSGELLIGGPCLARGYLNRADLTAQSFIPNPFTHLPGQRLYRTGDRVRQNADGQLIFLGRLDHQIKIRGFRIELGEIETQLASLSGVADILIDVYQGQADTNKQLVAFYAADEANQVSESQLRLAAKKCLPSYMLPNIWYKLESLPKTATGKMDRRALKHIELLEETSGSQKPTTPTESLLHEIWCGVMVRPEIGIHDNFFDLGGHSLMATRILTRVREVFKAQISIKDIFEHPSIAQQATFLVSQTAQGNKITALETVDPHEPVPLSFAQERFYFLEQLEPDVPLYNMVDVAILKGDLNRDAFEQALQQFVNRHHVLKSRIQISPEGSPQLTFQPNTDFVLQSLDLSNDSDSEQSLKNEIAAESKHKFKLDREAPYRFKLAKLAPDRHAFILNFHHIFADGWSFSIMMKDVGSAYEALCYNQPVDLPSLPFQYRDYAAWQKRHLQGEVLEQQLEYWRDHLHTEPLDLPTDKQRPAVPDYVGGQVRFEVPPSLCHQIRKYCREHHITPSMLFLAGYQLLLNRYTNAPSIRVGQPIAGRVRPELEGIFGLFANTLVLQADFSQVDHFQALLEQIKTASLNAYAHQEVPFEMLVDVLQPERQLNRNPLFQVLFNYHNMPEPSFDLRGLEISGMNFQGGVARFDFGLDIHEDGDQFNGLFTYATSLFEHSTAERIIQHLLNLIQSGLKQPMEPLSALEMLSSQEHQNWQSINDTQKNWGSAKTIVDLFAKVVLRYPHHEALVCGDERLSFADFDAASNRLANYLTSRGVTRESRVAICMDRSTDFLVAMLAALKANAVYVPIDATYPEDRCRFILQDCGAQLLITAGNKQLHSANLECVDLTEEKAAILNCSPKPPVATATPDNLAYIIYTSGTTGRPKGVAISHNCVFNLIETLKEDVSLEEAESWATVHSFSFDFSVWEIYGALLTGSKLVIITPEQLRDPKLMVTTLSQEKVTYLNETPSLMRQMLDGEPRAWEHLKLKALGLGGEALPKQLAKSLSDLPFDLWNFYGPTEATVWTSVTAVRPDDTYNNIMPIGQPFANMELYVLDANMRPQPCGIPGELVIGGVQLARCYENRPDLTAERFVPHPFSKEPGARLYRTGDLVCLRQNNMIDFLGRLDHQVKLRGYRIELGEIESLLDAHEDVEEAIVVVKQEKADHQLLVAFVVASKDVQLDQTQLKDYLGQDLPKYMVPDVIQMIDAMPLTSNRKVDRKALMQRELVIGSAHSGQIQSQTQELLANIWREVLTVETIGPQDHFFQLGGHSLQAVQLVNRIEKAFQISLPLRIVFEASTLEQMANAVESMIETGSNKVTPMHAVDRNQDLPLSYVQERFWFLHQAHPDDPAFNMPFALQIDGPLNVDHLRAAWQSLIERHEALRTRFVAIEGVPQQVIDPPPVFNLAVEDFFHDNPEIQEEKLKQRTQAESNRPFNLEEGPLFRVHLLQVKPERFIMLMNMHHIIGDGWSLNLLFGELAETYRANASGAGPELMPLPLQYADYAVWQRHHLSGAHYEQELSYWRKKLTPLPPQTLLPLTQNESTSPVGEHHIEMLTEELSANILNLGKQEHTTLFMTMIAALMTFFYRNTQQQDITVGTPVAGRDRAELEQIMGCFVNVLVLRGQLTEALSFQEFLKHVKQDTLQSFAHREMPFQNLVRELDPPRDKGQSPFFRVFFVLQNLPDNQIILDDLQFKGIDEGFKTAQYDLTLHATQYGNQIRLNWEYRAGLYDPATIALLHQRFATMLADLCDRPQDPIGSFNIKTATETLSKEQTKQRLKNKFKSFGKR